MADYFSVRAIAERMGVHPVTIAHWQLHRGFLVYKRWNTKTLRYVWYTNDDLIRTWELAQCHRQRPIGKPSDQRPPRRVRKPKGGMRGKAQEQQPTPESPPDASGL